MDLLQHFESGANKFWLAWQHLPECERAACKDHPIYRSALAHTLTIRHALMQPLLHGPAHLRSFNAAHVPEHPLSDSGSDDE